MTHCPLCLRPHPTYQEIRRERRKDRACRLMEWLLIAVIFSSVGYLFRDGVFLKRENTTLSVLLDKYVKRVETDKLVDHNTALRKGR